MNCKKCNSKRTICKGKIGLKQRYLCRNCGKYQQDLYSYKIYDENDDLKIKQLHAEGLGIRSLSRYFDYSPATIIRRILYLADKVTRPIIHQNNQVYEVDELWTFIGKNEPSNHCWIT